jgi:5-methylcytosine-specific restriction endonuclease McrA
MLQLDLLPSNSQFQVGVLLGMSEGVTSKVCSGPCGRDLPLDSFGKFKEGKYGRRSKCNECRAQEEKDRRASHPATEEQKEAARVRTREWNRANPDRKAATSKAWAENNPEAFKKITHRYRSKPEVAARLRESYRVWFKKNPEKARAASRNWRASHPEKMRELYQAWVSSNRERVRELNRKWCAEHPEHRRPRYEAVRNSDFTFDQWLEVISEFDCKCVYCGRSDVKLTMDHVIPISKGGPHTKDNIVPACRSCNSKKGAKDPSFFKFVVQRVQVNQSESRA